MASPSTTQTLDIQLHIPVEIWDEIIPKLNHDRHLQSLSRVSKFFLFLTNRHKQTLNILDPTAHFLPSLFLRFPNLKHLSLSDFHGDPVPILLQFADFNYPLQTLHLSYHHRLPVDALRRLPLSGVTSLKIRSLSAVSSDDDLPMIADLFPCLEELDLSCSESSDDDDGEDDYYEDYSGSEDDYDDNDGEDDYYDDGEDDDYDDDYDDGIFELTWKLKGLRRISLKKNRWITNKCLISLSYNCPNLEAISVKLCRKVTLFGIKSALRACKNLKMFGFQLCVSEFVDDIGEPLSQALNLLEIDISDADHRSDDLLLAVAKARLPLKSFTLGHGSNFTYAGLSSFLTSYDSLDHLALSWGDFLSDKAMIRLAKSLKEVRSVKLNHCRKISDSTLHTLIERCPLLETIEMIHTSIGIGEKNGFRGTNGFINTKITTLDLSWNRSLSNESLKKIALACPNLQTLRLNSCCGISAEGVGEILRNCPGLRHLEISNCGKVESLDLADTNTHALEFFVASAAGLNDNALIDISKKCPDLMFLNVMGCARVTSEGVGEVVDKCTKLKEINLHGCRNISGHFVARMVFSRPSLRKIVPPEDHLFSADEENLFMRHGCYVSHRQYMRGEWDWFDLF